MGPGRKAYFMDIDKYIEELAKLRQANGPGLQVVSLSPTGLALRPAVLPRVAYNRKGQSKSLWSTSDFDANKGDKVVVLNMPTNMAEHFKKAKPKTKADPEPLTNYGATLGRRK